MLNTNRKKGEGGVSVYRSFMRAHAAIFGTMGAIGATIGYHTGLKIAKSIPHLSFHTNLNNQS